SGEPSAIDDSPLDSAAELSFIQVSERHSRRGVPATAATRMARSLPRSRQCLAIARKSTKTWAQSVVGSRAYGLVHRNLPHFSMGLEVKAILQQRLQHRALLRPRWSQQLCLGGNV